MSVTWSLASQTQFFLLVSWRNFCRSNTRNHNGRFSGMITSMLLKPSPLLQKHSKFDETLWQSTYLCFEFNIFLYQIKWPQFSQLSWRGIWPINFAPFLCKMEVFTAFFVACHKVKRNLDRRFFSNFQIKNLYMTYRCFNKNPLDFNPTSFFT